MKIHILVFFITHCLPWVFPVPLVLSLSQRKLSPVSLVTSLYGLYKWLREPEVVEAPPYVAYGPPATFWIAEGERRAELRIPDSIPLQDTVGNFLVRRRLRRAATQPRKSWWSPGYGLLSLAAVMLYGLVYS